MAVITIPYDYSEITHPKIVPICIADIDVRERGAPVRLAFYDSYVFGAVVGDRIVDLAALQAAGLLHVPGAAASQDVFSRDTLNDFIALGRDAWRNGRGDPSRPPEPGGGGGDGPLRR